MLYYLTVSYIIYIHDSKGGGCVYQTNQVTVLCPELNLVRKLHPLLSPFNTRERELKLQA